MIRFLHAKDNSTTKFQDEIVSDHGKNVMNEKICGADRMVRR